MPLPSSTTTRKRKQLSGNEGKKISDKKKSAFRTQSLVNFVVSKNKYVGLQLSIALCL